MLGIVKLQMILFNVNLYDLFRLTFYARLTGFLSYVRFTCFLSSSGATLTSTATVEFLARLREMELPSLRKPTPGNWAFHLVPIYRILPQDKIWNCNGSLVKNMMYTVSAIRHRQDSRSRFMKKANCYRHELENLTLKLIGRDKKIFCNFII